MPQKSLPKEEIKLPKPELDLPKPEKELPRSTETLAGKPTEQTENEVQPSFVSSRSSFLSLKLLALVLILILIAISAFALLQNNAGKTLPPNPTPTKAIDEITNWKTYTNSNFGFSFSYPEAWGEVSISDSNGIKYINFISPDGQYGDYLISLKNKNQKHLDTDNYTLNIVDYELLSNGDVLLRNAGGGNETVKKDYVLENSSDGIIIYVGGLEEGSRVVFGLKKIELQNYNLAIFDHLSSDKNTEEKDLISRIMKSFKFTQ